MLMKLSINGVQTIFSAHNFKWVSNYTTVPPKTSLGFSKEEAFVTSSKVSSSKSTANPKSVIDFFEINGFSQSQIEQVVSKAPWILSCNVDKNLKPKILALYDLGFSKSDLAHFICLYPVFYCRSLNDHIIPTLEILKSVLGDDDEALIKTLKKWPWLLGPNAKKEVLDGVSLLQSYGLCDDQIKSFAERCPRYLTSGTKWLESILIRVENLGIPRGSGMFFHGICALSCYNEAKLEARKRMYKSYGFNDEDVLTLVRRSPYAFRLSESKLRSGLNFFMKEAGYLPSEIANKPNVLTYSLKKRVLPRYRVWKGLKERGIQKLTNNKIKKIAGFFYCLKISELDFFERFVQPFKDECPDLYSDYVKVVRPLKVAK